MKVLVVGPNSIHVTSFLVELSTYNSDIYLLAEETCDVQEVREQFILSFRSLNPIKLISANFRLKKILSDLKPDIVHIHQINRVAYFVSRLCKKLKIPVVSTAWGSDVLLIPTKSKFFHLLVKNTLQRSIFVTADSRDMIAAMQQICDDKKGKYVHLQYGINPVVPKEKENIIYSNRLHHQLYRIDQIIRYFSDICKERSDWRLIIAGIGEETEDLKKQVIDLNLEDRVKFVGWLPAEKNREWYAKSSIFVSIPMSDGTSVSLLEAMSAGCIPVVSDISVSKEWLTDGMNGIIEKKDSNPLEEAFELDPQKTFKLNSELIAKSALRSTCTKKFIALYEVAIQNK